MFFDDWGGLGRVLVVAPWACLSLLAALRLSGQRTLARFNALDLVVTVARLTEDEIRQAARGDGRAKLDEVAAVVLETDGTLSILAELPPALGNTDGGSVKGQTG